MYDFGLVDIEFLKVLLYLFVFKEKKEPLIKKALWYFLYEQVAKMVGGSTHRREQTPDVVNGTLNSSVSCDQRGVHECPCCEDPASADKLTKLN